ncbi:hypothetical protein [Candidatus Methylacidiphilum infernorum]|nr:hypothetical protein [Candidatus Methylacidiphilum infernorum]
MDYSLAPQWISYYPLLPTTGLKPEGIKDLFTSNIDSGRIPPAMDQIPAFQPRDKEAIADPNDLGIGRSKLLHGSCERGGSRVPSPAEQGVPIREVLVLASSQLAQIVLSEPL